MPKSPGGHSRHAPLHHGGLLWDRRAAPARPGRRPPPLPDLLRQLPARRGAKPQTSQTSPHLQLSGLGAGELSRQLVELVAALPGVMKGPSPSGRGAIALFVADWDVRQPRAEAPFGGEFAHVHPFNGGSVHVVLPKSWGEHACRLGWGEPHPGARDGSAPPVLFLLYGPRDENEVLALRSILRAAYCRVVGYDPDENFGEDGVLIQHRAATSSRSRRTEGRSTRPRPAGG